jgi:hypothetical protein
LSFFGDQSYSYRSGTLVSRTVFPTAAHCEIDKKRVKVTFDDEYAAGSRLHPGTFHANPLYPGAADAPRDIAAIVTVMWVGVAPPDAEVTVKPYDVFSRELTIRGSYTNPYVMDRTLALLASGRLDWEVIVTHRFPFSAFDEAWAVHSEGSGLKISGQPERDGS